VTSLALTNIDLGVSGLTAGRNYAIYWFPGLTTSSNTVPSSTFEIGGLNETVLFDGSLGMVIPTDGNGENTGILGTDLLGQVSTSRFNSIFAVPEPSSALLALLGLSLLRRRR